MECESTIVDKNERISQLEAVQIEAKELFKKKNADYGDAFATYGTVGILVRLGDKIQRLQSITSNGINLVEDEKIRDTLIDLHNYAAMGIMLLDEGIPSLNILVKLDNESDYEIDKVEEWDVSGSNNKKYKMQRITDKNSVITITCSCPSFTFCNNKVKSCKHSKKY